MSTLLHADQETDYEARIVAAAARVQASRGLDLEPGDRGVESVRIRNGRVAVGRAAGLITEDDIGSEVKAQATRRAAVREADGVARSRIDVQFRGTVARRDASNRRGQDPVPSC